jgi:hypothetical protein
MIGAYRSITALGYLDVSSLTIVAISMYELSNRHCSALQLLLENAIEG